MRPTTYGYPLLFAQHARPDRVPAPERFFSNTDYVMVPETPYNRLQLKTMMQGYGPYLEAHFNELARSPHGRLYARR